ncbi:trigger factor [Metallumcola ferriviriculae]|uniref:Trigger factor n=1 Tax=Metallumcola ferriviriculae TaxID=3039180 RepID=A0AAU0ULX8_9FIRM|nr:trigger factor [Desulfitibacteraceae bacterium MK1]
MKASVEKIENNRVTLEVEVENEVVAAAMTKAYTKLAKQVNIPGFRKGKAPRKVLENYIGTGPLLEEAVENVVPNAYIEAVEETNIEPIDQPDIEMVQLEEGKPIIFKASVDVKPEVTLGEYKGLEVAKEEKEITAEDVDKYLGTLRERYAKLVVLDKDQPAEENDTVVINFEGFLDGEPFEGGKAEEHPLVLGSDSFIPGFEEQLIGVKAGEEKEVNVTFPEDYQAEDLAGKDVVFKVQVKEIKRKELAPIDDEFAKDVSEFETLEELKEDTKNKLEETADEQINRAFRAQVTDSAVDAAKIGIPEKLITRRLEVMMDNFSQRLQQQGMSMEQYMEYTQSSMEDFKQQYRLEAEKSVKSDLVLEAIANAEDIKVTEEDMDAEIEKMAKMYNQDVKSLKAIMAAQDSLDSLKYGIMLDKAAEFLVDNAVPVVPIETKAPEESAKEE